MICKLMLLVSIVTAAPESKMDAAVSDLVMGLDHLTGKTMLKFVDSLADLKLESGESAAIRCEVTSTPSAVIFWEKDGKRVQGSDKLNLFEKITNTGKFVVESGIVSSIFHIPCASSKDSGVYKCIATNGHSTVESTAEIQVDGVDGKCPSTHRTAPKITLQTESRFEMSGNAATLVCRADKKADWTWTFSGEPIKMDDGRHEILPNGDLFIRNISWDDMGDYTCVASNKYGQSEAETFLYPTKKTVA
ncbi:CRE-ZIG-3 protein [Caenorhabditis remanei]|uniref:CRE-ZIG-3 protein n=1 Tax=Caenorhabditis remanei TaxID=31234 RepID=E3LCB0_CAERE|nr:CRE-ZIG-3 protein [Caenorhabditis remanei]